LTYLDQKWKICPERMIWKHFRKALHTLTVFLIQQTANEINKKQYKEPVGGKNTMNGKTKTKKAKFQKTKQQKTTKQNNTRHRQNRIPQ